MVIDVEFEISDLKRHVGEPEGAFCLLLQQIRVLHRDLLRFQAETRGGFKDLRQKLRCMDGRVEGVEGGLSRIESEVRHLRKDMPGIVGDAMRDVLREKNGR